MILTVHMKTRCTKGTQMTHDTVYLEEYTYFCLIRMLIGDTYVRKRQTSENLKYCFLMT